MRVRYLPKSRKVKPWARPWMIHCLGWILVFPIEFLDGVRLSLKDAREETKRQISEFDFDPTP